MILIKDLGQLKPTETSSRTYRYGVYQCPQCKEEYKMQTRYLKQCKDICKRCSAKERKNNLKHNGSSTRLYNIWKKIKSRCYNANDRLYKWYGSKGVTMCDEWINDFEAFRLWSNNNGYNETKVIDKDEISERLNVQKCYSPETCQWVSRNYNVKIRNRKEK